MLVACFSVAHRLLMSTSPDVSSRPWKANAGNVTGSTGDKVISAAIKVLDESLRAVSGFKGTEDLFDDKLFDTPFTSDFTRTKKVSSAPSYGSESLPDAKDLPVGCGVGSEQWSEAIDKHMPLVLRHNLPMVRAASVTCFAGITSVVFSSLPKEEQDFIISSCVNASLKDKVPSVRSAACRAIGVITCFPQISMSANTLCKFIHAAEVNTHDLLVLVRIMASWALANICDSLRHYINADTSNECSRDYGASFGDIIQGVEQTIENLSSDQITPSSFKYRIGLEKQLTSTMLHVLALASESNHQPVKDFLLKKASFVEEWLKVLCSSLGDTSMQQQLETEPNSSWKEGKKRISAAIMSLVEVFTDKNQPATAQKFDQLANTIP